MNKAWLAAVVVVPVVAAALAFGGCEVTIVCEDGACASSGVGTAASGTGGNAPACIEAPSDPNTNGFPPLVFAVLKKNCYACHTDPPQNFAPQPFLFYEQTQELYYTTDLTWWSQMREHAVKNLPPSMPLGLPPIPDCEKAILTEWFDTCGADTVAGMCEKGMGGTGTTSSSSASSSSGASSSSTGP